MMGFQASTLMSIKVRVEERQREELGLLLDVPNAIAKRARFLELLVFEKLGLLESESNNNINPQSMHSLGCASEVPVRFQDSEWYCPIQYRDFYVLILESTLYL
jgi:hypothetical protein